MATSVPSARDGIHKLKKRLQTNKSVGYYQPMTPQTVQPPGMNIVDEPFWKDLPDILQAQVLVAIDYGRPKKGQPVRAAEKLLWAGTPFLRTSKILSLFAIWVLTLVLPVFLLVEMVEDIGGWLALGWAFVSVFIFVPRVSASSRVVHVLTTQRAFTSRRTMFCSIETDQVRYDNVATAKMKVNKDGTGTIEMTYHQGPYEPMGRVKFDRIRDLRNALRVLDEYLPEEIRQAAEGFAPSSKELQAAEEQPEAQLIKPGSTTVAA